MLKEDEENGSPEVGMDRGNSGEGVTKGAV